MIRRTYEINIGNNLKGFKISEPFGISAQINNNTDQEPNSADIVLTNLNPENINKIISNEYNLIQVLAGYDNNNLLLFSGNIQTHKLEISTNNYNLTLKCYESAIEYGLSTISTTLNKGWSDLDIIKLASDSMKLKEPIIEIDQDAENKNNLNPITINESTKITLDRLAKKYNADWFITHNKLNFIKKSKPTKNAIKLINKTSGLIGNPETTAEGVDISTTLDAVEVGNLITLQSLNSYLNGTYKAKAVSYSLAYPSGDWLTKLTLIKVEAK